MKKEGVSFKLFLVILSAIIISMCVPPSGPSADAIAEKARIDSVRNVRCPRLMSSAAEYYHARDWESTVRVYREVVDLGCDDWDATFAPPEEIYQYYAIAYEHMGKFDSSEIVLLKGVEKIPNNIDLRVRLAFAYKRQGKTDKEIVEYERILDELDPNNIRVMTELASLYRKEGRYEEQIRVLQKLVNIDPTNEAAIADLTTAFERTGKDPLELYLEKYNNNPTATNGIQLADAYMENDRINEAIDILKAVSRKEPNNKMIFSKLGNVYILNEDYSAASVALEEVFTLDPRDYQTAIRISEVNSEIENFSKAIYWSDKAIKGTQSSGEALAAKGNVYYNAFHTCRTPEVARDDRIVARLAYKYFTQAENKGFRNVSGAKNWLRDNEVLFTKSDWFMLDAGQKSTGYATVKTACYNWITERLSKDPSW